MNFFSVVALLSTLAYVTASPVAPGPDANKVYIESIAYGGTGCPQGTVSKSMSEDKTTFTLIFDAYVVSIGQGVAITESRKNCQLNINLKVPVGWSYTVGTIDYRGYAQLPAGAIGQTASTYYFSGNREQCRTTRTFTGPMANDYKVRDTFDVNSLVWSDCKATTPVNIKNEIYVSSPNKALSAQMTTDSIDGKFTQTHSLSWKNCN